VAQTAAAVVDDPTGALAYAFVTWVQRRSHVPFVGKRWGNATYRLWRRVAVIALHSRGYSWTQIARAIDRGSGWTSNLYYRVQITDLAIVLAANLWPEFEADRKSRFGGIRAEA